jgi:general secretion pathway protein B
MSFILDALKKAERERALSHPSALATVRVERPRVPPRRWPWLPVLGGGLVLLLAGAVAVTLWRSGPSEVATHVEVPATADRRQVQVPQAAAPASPAVVPRSEDLSEARRAAVAAPPVTRPRAPASQAAAAVASAPPRPAARPVPVEPARPSPAAATPSEKAAAPAVPGPGEDIPRMKLEVHVYSESPAARLVFINGRKYVEGDRIDDKYLLERITENGATLTHQGQRLHLVP